MIVFGEHARLHAFGCCSIHICKEKFESNPWIFWANSRKAFTGWIQSSFSYAEGNMWKYRPQNLILFSPVELQLCSQTCGQHCRWERTHFWESAAIFEIFSGLSQKYYREDCCKQERLNRIIAVRIQFCYNFKLLQNDPYTGRIFSQPPNLVPRAFSLSWGRTQDREKALGTRLATSINFIQTRQKHR